MILGAFLIINHLLTRRHYMTTQTNTDGDLELTALVTNGFFQALAPFSAELIHGKQLKIRASCATPDDFNNFQMSQEYLFFDDGFACAANYKGMHSADGCVATFTQHTDTDGFNYWAIRKIPPSRQVRDDCKWILHVSHDDEHPHGSIGLISQTGKPGQSFSLIPYLPRCCG